MKGNLVSASTDFKTGKVFVTFLVDEVTDIPEGELNIEVKRYSEKRSLNMNSYFHLLVEKMAKVVKCSAPYMKNSLLQRYGSRMIDESGELVELIALESAHLDEREDIHCMPVGYIGDYIKYGVYEPTHTMTKEEFSYLLEGTVSEAKDLGIQTMTPEEIRRLEELWKPKSH